MPRMCWFHRHHRLHVDPIVASPSQLELLDVCRGKRTALHVERDLNRPGIAIAAPTVESRG
jgi:hypothetical protein